MKIHLVDGTYELFRNHFGAPPKKTPAPRALSITCASDAQRPGASPLIPNTITVLVRTPEGTPAAGTTVRFRQAGQDVAQGVTDASGSYQSTLPPGGYTVQVEAEGRALAAEGIRLDEGCAVNLALVRP